MFFRSFLNLTNHREQQLPPRGIDDIHLNQGTPSSQYQCKDNGPYQDGALFIANDIGSYNAIFFAFDSRCFKTNNEGNCIKDEHKFKNTTAKQVETV